MKELRPYIGRAHMYASPVISVWGMPGTGKSALVRNLFNKDVHRKNREFQKYGWVDVRHPFDMWDIYHSLFLQFESHSPQEGEDCDGIVKMCHNSLKYHRCLVVIDNLQSKEDWEAIDILPFRTSANIIIVITNDESIALHCANREEFVFNVKALEARPAFELFRREVRLHGDLAKHFSSVTVARDGHDVEETKVIQSLISMCGGLPKVIVAVSGYLARKKKWLRKGEQLGDKFIVDLETWPQFTCLRDLFLWIHYYFRSCPDYLKPCMFYLSIFRRSQIIRRRRLLMRWIAEGYTKDKASDTAEDNGEEIFAKMIELSMIQPPEGKVVTSMRMVWCQLSSFFNEYFITRPKGENVTFALEVFSLEGFCRQSTGRTGRHLVIEESWKRDRIVFEAIDFSRLRSLTVFGEWESFFVSKSMKVLRVLDLENATGVENKDLEIMLKLLPRLKFLSLRGCSEITRLPASLGDLRQLQILDIRNTSVVVVPASIKKLKRLQYLRAGNKRNESASGSVSFKLSHIQRSLQLVGVNVESGVGQLSALHTLGVVNVGGAGGKNILNELKNLTQLRKIGVSGVCRKSREKFFSAISDHSHLHSLSVWLKEKNGDALCEMPPEAKPPKVLQSLKLYGPLKKLPEWIEQLNKIRKLNLEIDILSAEDINVLGKLKELCILRLHVKPKQDEVLEFCVRTCGIELGCYKKLKVLEISSRSDLRLTIGSAAMKNLELLEVRSCCSGSELKFAGLKHLFKLKKIWIVCSKVKELKKYLEKQFCNKPVIELEEVNASAEASIGGHNNIIASTGDENHHAHPSTSQNDNSRVTTGGNDQTQTTTGGNSLTQTHTPRHDQQ